MKKLIVPVFALFLFSAAASAQQKVPQKGVSAASTKTVVNKPTGNTTHVTPTKTVSPVTVTKTTTKTKSAGIKRKHPKTKKGKSKSKKM
ncbi:MAG: hypothetical protein ABI688_06160 [Bacteroidota bacterium]